MTTYRYQERHSKSAVEEVVVKDYGGEVRLSLETTIDGVEHEKVIFMSPASMTAIARFWTEHVRRGRPR